MRLAIVLPFLALAATACKPEISRNTYFCGPDSLCPPNLACQLGSQESFAYNCVLPRELEAFSCPVVTSDLEPDDEVATARVMGEINCGEQLVFDDWGCIADGSDVDHFQFTRPTDCTGSDPRVRLTLRYPLGAAPLSVELLDDAGQVLSLGALCTEEQDGTGTEQLCIDNRDLGTGTYSVRVQVDDAGNADCDGTCVFNRYQLIIASPVSQ